MKLRILLPAVNDDSKNGNCENAGNNLNGMRTHYLYPPFRQNPVLQDHSPAKLGGSALRKDPMRDL